MNTINRIWQKFKSSNESNSKFHILNDISLLNNFIVVIEHLFRFLSHTIPYLRNKFHWNCLKCADEKINTHLYIWVLQFRLLIILYFETQNLKQIFYCRIFFFYSFAWVFAVSINFLFNFFGVLKTLFRLRLFPNLKTMSKTLLNISKLSNHFWLFPLWRDLSFL